MNKKELLLCILNNNIDDDDLFLVIIEKMFTNKENSYISYVPHFNMGCSENYDNYTFIDSIVCNIFNTSIHQQEYIKSTQYNPQYWEHCEKQYNFNYNLCNTLESISFSKVLKCHNNIFDYFEKYLSKNLDNSKYINIFDTFINEIEPYLKYVIINNSYLYIWRKEYKNGNDYITSNSSLFYKFELLNDKKFWNYLIKKLKQSDIFYFALCNYNIYGKYIYELFFEDYKDKFINNFEIIENEIEKNNLKNIYKMFCGQYKIDLNDWIFASFIFYSSGTGELEEKYYLENLTKCNDIGKITINKNNSIYNNILNSYRNDLTMKQYMVPKNTEEIIKKLCINLGLNNVFLNILMNNYNKYYDDIIRHNINKDYLKNYLDIKFITLVKKDLLKHVKIKSFDYDLTDEILLKSLDYIYDNINDFDLDYILIFYIDLYKNDKFTVDKIPLHNKYISINVYTISKEIFNKIPSEYKDSEMYLYVYKNNYIDISEIPENKLNELICMEAFKNNTESIKYIPKKFYAKEMYEKLQIFLHILSNST